MDNRTTTTAPGANICMPVYRAGAVNHCPGCSHTHWHVGRATAQCAFCATALPLAETETPASGTMWTRSSVTCSKAI